MELELILRVLTLGAEAGSCGSLFRGLFSKAQENENKPIFFSNSKDFTL